MISIKTIMDNLPSEQKALKAEHGLSFYVETEYIRLLFDFGAGPATFENLKKMNIRTDQMDMAVCSHSHYDHAGGYPHMVERKLLCPMVTGVGFFDEKYAAGKGKHTYLGCGFQETLLKENHIRHTICKDMLKLAEGCYVVGNFERTHTYETIQKRFVRREAGEWRQDKFEDEICLALDTEQGVVVIAGCSHPGILNILETVKKRLNKSIRAVVGGTHLVEADESRIAETIEEMKCMGVTLMGLNHCSGRLVQEILEKETQVASVYLGVGDCLFI